MINIASPMRHRLCGKLHGGLSHLLFTGPARHRSIASYIANDRDLCPPHLHSTHPLEGSLSECCHDVWYGKTRMVQLPDDEKILKICLFILTKCTNVTDRQTPHDAIGNASIALHGNNYKPVTAFKCILHVRSNKVTVY